MKQIKFSTYVISISVVFVLLASWLFISSFMEQYEQVISIFQIVDSKKKWDLIINDVFSRNLLKVFALFLFFIIFMIVVLFRLTHRYYGPLVSIERFVDAMIQKEYSSRVTIRKKDELQRLVGKLNQMADVIENSIHEKGNNSVDKNIGTKKESQD